jgi:hypothetical protein
MWERPVRNRSRKLLFNNTKPFFVFLAWDRCKDIQFVIYSLSSQEVIFLIQVKSIFELDFINIDTCVEANKFHFTNVYVHINGKIPVTVRSQKSSPFEPDKYRGGGPRGNVLVMYTTFFWVLSSGINCYSWKVWSTFPSRW